MVVCFLNPGSDLLPNKSCPRSLWCITYKQACTSSWRQGNTISFLDGYVLHKQNPISAMRVRIFLHWWKTKCVWKRLSIERRVQEAIDTARVVVAHVLATYTQNTAQKADVCFDVGVYNELSYKGKYLVSHQMLILLGNKMLQY